EIPCRASREKTGLRPGAAPGPTFLSPDIIHQKAPSFLLGYFHSHRERTGRLIGAASDGERHRRGCSARYRLRRRFVSRISGLGYQGSPVSKEVFETMKTKSVEGQPVSQAPSKAEVRETMRRILTSRHFVNAPTKQRFLQLICESYLNGRASELN